MCLNRICVLVLTTLKMATKVAEICWLLWTKITFIHASASVGLLLKKIVHVINARNIKHTKQVDKFSFSWHKLKLSGFGGSNTSSRYSGKVSVITVAHSLMAVWWPHWTRLSFGSRRLWTFSLPKLQLLWPFTTLLDMAVVLCNTFQPSSNNKSHVVLASLMWALRSYACKQSTSQHNGTTAQSTRNSGRAQLHWYSHTKTSVAWFILQTQLQYQNVLLSQSRIWPPEYLQPSALGSAVPLSSQHVPPISFALIALIITEGNQSWRSLLFKFLEPPVASIRVSRYSPQCHTFKYPQSAFP
jgi:hypothetical protein